MSIILTSLSRREIAVFAHVFSLPDSILIEENKTAVLVTVNTVLGILVPANTTRSSIYLDIPFDRISNIKMSKLDSLSQHLPQHSQSQTTTSCYMNIELRDLLEWTHFVNYKGGHASSIGIFFNHMPDAIAVNEALDARHAVSHDHNVSLSQPQYDLTNPVTETSTDRQDGSFPSEPEASMRVLQATESDLITCADDEARDKFVGLEGGSNIGTLRTDRKTALGSVRIPLQAEIKRNSSGDANGGTAEVEIVQGTLAANISHTLSEHLLSSSASQQLNGLVTESAVQKRSTKTDWMLTVRKWKKASSTISLQTEYHDAKAISTLRAARDDKISGKMSKEVRTIDRTAQCQGPTESKVNVMEKRCIKAGDPGQATKSRVAGWQPHQDLDGARAEIQTPKINAPDLRRKPVVVDFEASGPENTRTRLPKKNKVPADQTIPQSKQDQHSKTIQRSKRKPFDTVNNGPSAMDDLPNRKRSKGEHTNMLPISRGETDALTVQPGIHSSTGQVYHHGSQSSRVNEPGSLMPTVYSREVSLAIPKVIAPTPEIPKFSSDVFGNKEYYCSDDETLQIPEPSVPARHGPLAPIAKIKAVVGRNTKHRPGSNNTPSSIIANKTAHRIQPSGQFVGIQINDVVVPQKPRDPVVDTVQNQPASKFLEILRKFDNEQKLVENVNDNERHEDRKIATHVGSNDPDKTLFEENRSENEESSTSSSCTSEIQSQGDAAPSDDGSDSDSAWNKALRDDQRDIFEKLHEISHVDVCCHPSCVRC